MTNQIMLLACANENTVSIRTVSTRMKSPQHFYICYEEFDCLQRDGRIITSDIHSFAKIRLDEKHDRIEFQFTWLSGRSFDSVEGTEQAVTLHWSTFQVFLRDCRQPDGPTGLFNGVRFLMNIQLLPGIAGPNLRGLQRPVGCQRQ